MRGRALERAALVAKRSAPNVWALEPERADRSRLTPETLTFGVKDPNVAPRSFEPARSGLKPRSFRNERLDPDPRTSTHERLALDTQTFSPSRLTPKASRGSAVQIGSCERRAGVSIVASTGLVSEMPSAHTRPGNDNAGEDRTEGEGRASTPKKQPTKKANPRVRSPAHLKGRGAQAR